MHSVLSRLFLGAIFEMIITCCHGRPLIFSRVTFWVRYVSHHQAMRNMVSPLFIVKVENKDNRSDGPCSHVLEEFIKFG